MSNNSIPAPTAVPLMPQLSAGGQPGVAAEQAQLAADREGTAAAVYQGIESRLAEQHAAQGREQAAALASHLQEAMQPRDEALKAMTDTMASIADRVATPAPDPTAKFHLTDEEQQVYGDALPIIDKRTQAAVTKMQQQMQADMDKRIADMEARYAAKFSNIETTQSHTQQGIRQQYVDSILEAAQQRGIDVNKLEADPKFNELLDAPTNPYLPLGPNNSVRREYERMIANPSPESVAFFNGLFDAYGGTSPTPTRANPYPGAAAPRAQQVQGDGKEYKVGSETRRVGHDANAVYSQLNKLQEELTSVAPGKQLDELLAWGDALREAAVRF